LPGAFDERLPHHRTEVPMIESLFAKKKITMWFFETSRWRLLRRFDHILNDIRALGSLLPLVARILRTLWQVMLWVRALR
jgi:hypothetical protein